MTLNQNQALKTRPRPDLDQSRLNVTAANANANSRKPAVCVRMCNYICNNRYTLIITYVGNIITPTTTTTDTWTPHLIPQRRCSGEQVRVGGRGWGAEGSDSSSHGETFPAVRDPQSHDQVSWAWAPDGSVSRSEAGLTADASGSFSSSSAASIYKHALTLSDTTC